MYIYIYIHLPTCFFFFIFHHSLLLFPSSRSSPIPHLFTFCSFFLLITNLNSSKFIISSQFERSKNFSISFRNLHPPSIYLYYPQFSFFPTLTPYSSSAPPPPFIFTTSHSSLRCFHVRHILLVRPSISQTLYNPPFGRPTHPPPRSFQPTGRAFCSAQLAACRQAVSTTEGRKIYTGWLEFSSTVQLFSSPE